MSNEDGNPVGCPSRHHQYGGLTVDTMTSWKTAGEQLIESLIAALRKPLPEVNIARDEDTFSFRIQMMLSCADEDSDFDVPPIDVAVEALKAVLRQAVSEVANPYPSEMYEVERIIGNLERIAGVASIGTARSALAEGATLLTWLSAPYPTRLDVDDWQAQHGDYFGDPNGEWAYIDEMPKGWHFATCLWCSNQFPTPDTPQSEDGDNDPMWCSANCQKLHLGND